MEEPSCTTASLLTSQTPTGGEGYEEPIGDKERAIARVWAQVFQREGVDRNANFFELGGDSLLAMEIAEKLAAEFHIELPAIVLFLNPTPRLLADCIAALKYSRNSDSGRQPQTPADDQELLSALPGSRQPRLLECLQRSRAQFRQDLFVLAELDFKERGYFAQFTGADDATLSNTYLLEKEFGWKGFVAAVAALPSPEDLFVEHAAPPLIDYLSITTGGFELELLRRLDFTTYRFRVITCEHRFTSERDDIYALLTQHGYIRKYREFSKSDDWYVLVK